MSPRPSNRDALIEGALRCLEEQGYAAVRTRDIAAAAGANLASIGYHFGSKDELLGEALRVGFHRWLAEVSTALPVSDTGSPRARLASLAAALRTSFERHRSLVLAFIEAVARAPRDETLRQSLAESYRDTRSAVAMLVGLGDDEVGYALAASLIATFDGLLIQWLIDPQATPSANELIAGIDRVQELLAKPTSES